MKRRFPAAARLAVFLALTSVSCAMNLSEAGEFRNFLFYVNPKDYVPYSMAAVKEAGLKELWNHPLGTGAYQRCRFKDLGGQRALAWIKGEYTLLINGTGTEKPDIFRIDKDIDNYAVDPAGLLVVSPSSLELYDWKTGKPSKQLKISLTTLRKKQEQVSSNAYTQTVRAVVQDGTFLWRKEGRFYVFYAVDYRLYVDYAYGKQTGVSKDTNSLRIAVLDSKDWTLTASRAEEFPATGRLSVFANLESMDIKDGKDLIVGFNDGEDHHYYGHMEIGGMDPQKLTLTNAEGIVRMFPGTFSLQENKPAEAKSEAEKKMGAAQGGGNSAAGGQAVKFGPDQIRTVHWYEILDDGIVSIATDSTSARSLYKVSLDLKQILWKKPLMDSLSVDKAFVISASGLVFLPAIHSADGGGCYRSFALATGKEEKAVIPMNLSTSSNAASAVDTAVLDDGTGWLYYDDRSRTLKYYRYQ